MKKKLSLGILFIIVLAFFFFQHSYIIQWDYAAYADNALHMLGETAYFEWMRPPLYPLVLAFFLIFGNIGEYLMIFSTLFAFFIVSFLFAKVWRIDEGLFILFMLQPIFFIYAFGEGTELFTLIFLMLFLIILCQRRIEAGIFLGLGILSRYNLIYFTPLILFQKGWSRKGMTLLLAGAPFAIWGVVNYFFTGNIFSSIVDNYSLNKIFRAPLINQPIQWNLLFILFIIPVVFFFLGVYKMAKKRKLHTFRNAVMLLIIPIIIYPYAGMPLKVIRYLFFLILPFSYFASVFFQGQKIRRALIILSLILQLSFVILSLFVYGFPGTRLDIPSLKGSLDSHGLGRVQVMSNAWVHLNYYGIPSIPYPGIDSLDYYLLSGKKVIVSKKRFIGGTGFEMGQKNFSDYPLIYEDKNFAVLGISSIEGKYLPMDKTYLENLQDARMIRYNEHFDSNPCNVMFRPDLANKICHLINLESTETVWQAGISKGHQINCDSKLVSFESCENQVCEALNAEVLSVCRNRTYYLDLASSRWREAGVNWRSYMLSVLAEGFEPIPKTDSRYYAVHRDQAIPYCSIEDCRFPVIAANFGGYWYLPDNKGVYKYRTDVSEAEDNLYMSGRLMRISQPDKLEVLP